MVSTGQAAELLDTVESLSSPGTFYEIRKGSDGLAYCTCPAWRFCKRVPHTCKHLTRWLTGEYVKVQVMGLGEVLLAEALAQVGAGAPVEEAVFRAKGTLGAWILLEKKKMRGHW